MEFIPIEPDENLASFLDSAQQFPFVFVEINNPGDYENENIVFKANENIDSLSDYMVLYMVEDTTTGIPDYSKCRILTFDDVQLQKVTFSRYTPPQEITPQPSVSKLQIYTT